MHTLSDRDPNRLLAALPAAQRRQLEPHLEWAALPLGATLHAAGGEARHVYFPATAVVSLVSSLSDGASAESAVVGREGVVGVIAFLGGGSNHSSAVVQRAGHAWRLGAAAMARHAQQSPDLMRALLAYTQALLVQIAQTSACNRHHAIDQQLCRWLLLHLDRQQGHDMMVTQERIATLLGVRREGVTVGAIKLQEAGVIRYARGRVSVLDRAGLEQRSCECYRVVRNACDRLSQGAPPEDAAPATQRTPRIGARACA